MTDDVDPSDMADLDAHLWAEERAGLRLRQAALRLNQLELGIDLSSLEDAVQDVQPLEEFAESELPALADRWLRIRSAARDLAVIERDYANAVGSRLADVEYNRSEGYELPDGTRIRHEQARSERWEGRKLLRTLSTPMVEPSSGELIESIPLKVLADIIPGVGTDDQTSSKWKLTGLRNLDINPDDYRTIEWRAPHAELGGRGR